MSEITLHKNNEEQPERPRKLDVKEVRRRIEAEIQKDKKRNELKKNEKITLAETEQKPQAVQIPQNQNRTIQTTPQNLEQTIQQTYHTYTPSEEDKYQQKEPLPDLQPEKTFTLLELIGNGGFGEVWKAQWYTGDIVTVKYCDEMDKEILAKDINHPNITKTLEYGQDEKGKYIIREYVNGKSLKELLGKNAKLTEQEFFTIAYQIIIAIQYLHKQGLAHGDIKPENILIPEDLKNEFVKVTDFGLSRSMQKDVEQSIDTTVIRGTIDYMAPEQLYERQRPTQHSDIYSLGKLLLRMQTGKLQHHPSTTVLKHKFGTNKLKYPQTAQLNEEIELCLLQDQNERTQISKIKHSFENFAKSSTKEAYKIINEHKKETLEFKTKNETKLLPAVLAEVYRRTIATIMPGYTLYQQDKIVESDQLIPHPNIAFTGVFADIFIYAPLLQSISMGVPHALSEGMYLIMAGLAGKLITTAYLDHQHKTQNKTEIKEEPK